MKTYKKYRFTMSLLMFTVLVMVSLSCSSSISKPTPKLITMTSVSAAPKVLSVITAPVAQAASPTLALSPTLMFTPMMLASINPPSNLPTPDYIAQENISFLGKSDQQMFFTYFKNLYLAKLPGDVDGYQPEVTPKPSTNFAFGDQICVMMDLIKPIETGNLVETIYDAQTKKVIKYFWPVIPFQTNVSHKDCFTVAETCSPIMVNDLCLPAGNNEIWISFDGNTAVLPFSIKH